jgi:hypothetical protein
MVEFGYLLAVGLILMVIGVHGARILKQRRAPRLDGGRAESAPAVGYN